MLKTKGTCNIYHYPLYQWSRSFQLFVGLQCFLLVFSVFKYNKTTVYFAFIKRFA